MIYTINLNSSLDYIMHVKHFRAGKTNRTECDSLVCGGKGINVAKVLSTFGLSVKAFVVTAGFVGAEIERQLSAEGVDCAFFRVSGNSRINVKLKSNVETEINGMGAGVPDETIEDIAAALAPSPNWLVLSGNAPLGTRSDVYHRLSFAAGGAKVAVDAWGDQLRFALEAHPFLIKPNLDELCDFFGKNISYKEAGVYAMREQQTYLYLLAASGPCLRPQMEKSTLHPHQPADLSTQRGQVTPLLLVLLLRVKMATMQRPHFLPL